jgi:hypothetical protein
MSSDTMNMAATAVVGDDEIVLNGASGGQRGLGIPLPVLHPFLGATRQTGVHRIRPNA